MEFSDLFESEPLNPFNSGSRIFSKLFILSVCNGDEFSLKLVKKRRYFFNKISTYCDASEKSKQKSNTYSHLNLGYVNNLEGDLIKIWKALSSIKKLKALKRIKMVPSGFISPEFAMCKIFKKLFLNKLQLLDLGFVSKTDHRVIPRLIGRTKAVSDLCLIRSGGFQGTFNDWIEKKTHKIFVNSIKANEKEIVSLRIDLPLFFLFNVKDYISMIPNLCSLSLVAYSLQENDIIASILPNLPELKNLTWLALTYFAKMEEIFVFDELELISSIQTLKKFWLKVDIEFKKRVKKNYHDLAKKLENIEELVLDLTPKSINFAVKRSYYDFFTKLMPLCNFKVLKLSLDCNFTKGNNADLENFCTYLKTLGQLKVLSLVFYHRNLLPQHWKTILGTISKLENLEELELVEENDTNLDMSLLKILPQKLQKLRRLRVQSVIANDDERELIMLLITCHSLESVALVVLLPQEFEEYSKLFLKMKECHIKIYTNQFPRVINHAKNFLKRQDPLFTKFYSLSLKFASIE